MMANESAIQNKREDLESLDFDELEKQLQDQLEGQLSDLDFIQEQSSQIGNPEALGNVILGTIWEQFTNQIAVQAGEDFIKDNNGLHLDLRNEAHIQTAENFEKGKIADHNKKTDYSEKHDDYISQFKTDPNKEYRYKDSKNHKYDEDTKTWSHYNEKKGVWEPKERYNDEKGVWESYDMIDGTWKKELKDETVRAEYDKGRPVGKNGNHKDHQISVDEIIGDPEANAFMSKEERIKFANSDKNLNDLDSSANQSKGNHNGEKWLNHEREEGSKGEGQTNAEYFGIDDEEFEEKERIAREEYEKQKRQAEEKAIKEGKESQKEEAFRISKKAVRAVIMNLLADLVKKIIIKLILWLKSTSKNLKSLLIYIKDAIVEFVTNLKTKVINVMDTAVTVIATSIIGPIISTVKKAWMFIKQGWISLKQSIDYIKAPENKGKTFGIMMMEVGKIVMAGMTAIGAIVLGEVIEKGLMTIPLLAFEIPMFGSLANIIGVFMGAVISGIIGALAINLINNLIAKRQRGELEKDKIDKKNEVLSTQGNIILVNGLKLNATREDAAFTINGRHSAAAQVIRNSFDRIIDNNGRTNDNDFKEMHRRIENLNRK